MTGRHVRVAVCLLAVAALLGGCVGTGPSPGAARERALAAEEEYVTARLSNATCVREWSLRSFTGIDREASVVERTDDGAVVAVTQPYTFTTAQADADAGSTARYLVTSDETRRLNGTTVAPCGHR